jgi:Domain of unknown function (DUF4124)
MNNLIGAHKRRLLAGAALVLFSGACAALAHAQYLWVDEKGIKQFSDRPPPPSTPLKKILKAPGMQLPERDSAAPGEAAAAPAADTATKPKAELTLAERNADFRKRGKEQAEREQKAAEEAQRKSELAENCEAARENRQQLDSGVRISTTDKNGERNYMGDAERAQRSAKVNKTLAQCR